MLSTTKGFSTVLFFVIGVVSSWIENCSAVGSTATDKDESGRRSDETSVTGSLCELSVSTCADLNTGIKTHDDPETSLQQQPPISSPLTKTLAAASTPEEARGGETATSQEADASSRGRKVIFYTVLVGIVAVCRSSSNIAAAKWTYPYNSTLISSTTPLIIAVFDRILLSNKQPFPPLFWPAIVFSILGGALVAMGQTSDSTDMSSQHIHPTHNLIGCLLQFTSVVFSACQRTLMKLTVDIFSRNHFVQANNIPNCVFPFIIATIHDPSGWKAFRYLFITPKSLLAWCTISIGVYSYGLPAQVSMVQNIGPGLYSSFEGVRVLGSLILSTLLLGEGLVNWIEWVGLGLVVVTMTVYIVQTSKWVESRDETNSEDVSHTGGRTAGGEEDQDLARPLLDGHKQII